MIKVEHAEATLLHMLESAGVELQSPDVESFWRVYKEFIRIPVEVEAGEDDALLFQWGRDDANDVAEGSFYLDFTRQFCIDDEDGEYEHIEQLSATLRYAQGVEPGAEAGNFWSYDFGNSFDRFVDGVESSEVFRRLRAASQPERLEIMQECV